MAIALHYAARSDVGLVRSENQDSGYAGPNLLVIADGMGGHAAGDVASSVTIGQLVGLDGESHGADDVIAHLETSLGRANTEIQTLIQSHPELQGMGTTVTALLRTGNKLAMAHIGDSRAYLMRGDSFEQITHDHSFVQQLVDEGRITAEEAETHPQRSLVTRVLTGQRDDVPDVSIREARVGDRYLLCSDGLSGFVAADTIEDVLRSGEAPAPTCERLVQLALRAGAPDNVTVVVADVTDLDAGPSPAVNPQIVGAASVPKPEVYEVPVTPAQKAAALSREATAPEEQPVPLAEEGRPSRLGRTLRVTAATLLAVVVLGGGAWGAYAWTQGQYYVGVEDGNVAVFRGVSQDLGPLSLSAVEDTTDVPLEDLPDFYRGQVEGTIPVDSMRAANAKVFDLRTEARICQQRKASGQTCTGVPSGSSTQAPPASPSSTTTTSSSSASSTATTPAGTATGTSTSTPKLPTTPTTPPAR